MFLFLILGVEDVDIFHDHDLNSIQHQNPLVLQGGEGKPEDCVSYQKVAIIVPYRNRYFHLKLLLSRLHPLLRKQKIHYRIFVIEQVYLPVNIICMLNISINKYALLCA